jgi:hypothetical protein
MRILADENMDGEIVSWLRNAGHDVLWIVEHLPGMPDAEIATLAISDHPNI